MDNLSIYRKQNIISSIWILNSSFYVHLKSNNTNIKISKFEKKIVPQKLYKIERWEIKLQKRNKTICLNIEARTCQSNQICCFILFQNGKKQLLSAQGTCSQKGLCMSHHTNSSYYSDADDFKYQNSEQCESEAQQKPLKNYMTKEC